MYRDLTIAAVVPAYNEEKQIARVVETMPSLVDHIVIVDDKSSDRTAEVARATGDPRVTVIVHEENQGVGGAILTAHTRALELGADVDVVMAGDAQMDPDYVTDLVDPLIDDGAMYAKANRFYSADSFEGMPRYRIFGNIVLSFMTKLASGYWNLFDPQNGYTAIRAEMLDRLDFDKIKRRYEFENDMLINLNILNARVVDVPIPAVYADEQSSIKLRKVVPALVRLLFSGYWHRVMQKYVIRSFSPIALFLFTGLLLVAWGIGFGIWVLIQTLGPEIASTGTVILSVVPFLLGVQFLLYSLVLDIQVSPDWPPLGWSTPHHRARTPRRGPI